MSYSIGRFTMTFSSDQVRCRETQMTSMCRPWRAFGKTKPVVESGEWGSATQKAARSLPRSWYRCQRTQGTQSKVVGYTKKNIVDM